MKWIFNLLKRKKTLIRYSAHDKVSVIVLFKAHNSSGALHICIDMDWQESIYAVYVVEMRTCGEQSKLIFTYFDIGNIHTPWEWSSSFTATVSLNKDDLSIIVQNSVVFYVVISVSCCLQWSKSERHVESFSCVLTPCSQQNWFLAHCLKGPKASKQTTADV